MYACLLVQTSIIIREDGGKVNRDLQLASVGLVAETPDPHPTQGPEQRKSPGGDEGPPPAGRAMAAGPRLQPGLPRGRRTDCPAQRCLHALLFRECAQPHRLPQPAQNGDRGRRHDRVAPGWRRAHRGQHDLRRHRKPADGHPDGQGFAIVHWLIVHCSLFLRHTRRSRRPPTTLASGRCTSLWGQTCAPTWSGCGQPSRRVPSCWSARRLPTRTAWWTLSPKSRRWRRNTASCATWMPASAGSNCPSCAAWATRCRISTSRCPA